MAAKYHALENIQFTNGILVVEVVELNEGEPDGLVGLPLEVTLESGRHTVQFSSIAGFQSVPEPLNGLSQNARRINQFMFLESNSDYLHQNGEDLSPFVYGAIRPESPVIQHYVVFGENTVLHVLAALPPTISKGPSQA